MDMIDPDTVQTQERKRTGWRSWRAGLEVATSVALLAAATAVLWGAAGRMFPGPPPARPEVQPPAELQSLDGSHLKGSAQARVAVLAYSDFQCPFCGRFARDVFPALEKQYLTSGKVAFGFRHFPLVQIHPLATKAAVAAECGAQQGKFWEMHDALFRVDASLEPSGLLHAAGQAGLDVKKAQVCLEKDNDKVQEEAKRAQALNLTSTPIFLIGKIEPGGLRVTKVLRGAQPASAFSEVIDRLLQQ